MEPTRQAGPGAHRRGVPPNTASGAVTATQVGLPAFVLLVLLVMALSLSSAKSEHDPRDLSYWSQAGATQNGSAVAGQGTARGEFCLGVALIRTNAVMFIERVPVLSSLPIVGKRWFERTSYRIDDNISPERLAEAYRRIQRSADQGFPPAKEVEKLLRGRLGAPGQRGPRSASQVVPSAAASSSSGPDAPHRPLR